MQIMVQQIEETILINASPVLVWDYLTQPELMKSWMAEEDISMGVITSW